VSLVTVTGEALVDFVPDQQGTRQWTAGGSGLNTALALARLGVPTTFSGALSQDENGARLAAFMRAEQIDLAHHLESEKPCPHVLVSKDAQGVPHYDLHLADSALEDAPDLWRWPSGTRHFHATSFAATLGAGGKAALASLQAARGTLTTSFDPNIRAGIFPDRAAIPLLLAERIRHADIVKVSSEDLFAIAPEILHDHVVGEWRTLGPRLIIITRGAQGATALFGTSQIDVPAPQIKVCDTVGAGDTFMGALLAAMSEDKALGALPQLEETQVARWLLFAVRAAALSCMRAGADPPTRQMIDAQA
jgi:fructokinase